MVVLIIITTVLEINVHAQNFSAPPRIGQFHCRSAAGIGTFMRSMNIRFFAASEGVTIRPTIITALLTRQAIETIKESGGEYRITASLLY